MAAELARADARGELGADPSEAVVVVERVVGQHLGASNGRRGQWLVHVPDEPAVEERCLLRGADAEEHPGFAVGSADRQRGGAGRQGGNLDMHAGGRESEQGARILGRTAERGERRLGHRNQRVVQRRQRPEASRFQRVAVHAAKQAADRRRIAAHPLDVTRQFVDAAVRHRVGVRERFFPRRGRAACPRRWRAPSTIPSPRTPCRPRCSTGSPVTRCRGSSSSPTR